MTGPIYFAQSVISGSHPILDWFHLHEALALTLTVLALALVRLGSSLMPQFRPRQPWLISCCELLLVVGIMLQADAIHRNLYPHSASFVDNLAEPPAEPFRRPVEQQLAAMPGLHLVLVRYSKDHNSGEEYVYNDADIDRAKTVWAREIPGMDLSPLLSYFRNRDVWVFEPDVDDESVSPYQPQSAAPR